MYELITSAKDNDELSIGFDRDRNRRQNELSNKKVKVMFHVRIMLKDVFGFAEHQVKATYGLGYILTLTRKEDDAVLQKAVSKADSSYKFDHILWYVAHYTPSIQQQAFSSKQFLSKRSTELRFVERSVFVKEINIQHLENFELGFQESMKVPIWIIKGFQQSGRQDSQTLNIHSFCRLPVTSCQCIIGTQKCPDAGILINYGNDNYSQGNNQVRETFIAF